ncbi:hypothetical protein DFH27DRAFT_534524 [Peziza echinospora]|nr:hypothetical protein DFH27DRAFT_534524 [Peziza echinospora]
MSDSNTMEKRFQPHFYHCLTKHSRFTPQKHSFQYSYLLVGFPISWTGSEGKIFSVRQSSGKLPWTFFSVNSEDYINRGKESLHEKLEEYLKENDLNIDNFPNIYLVTAPRFMGYQFNPVSFWYLYDGDGNLSIVIMEVNNTFDERHLYIMHQRPESFTANSQYKLTQQTQKVFHVSPFNDREGEYNLRAFDPLRPLEANKKAMDMTITLLAQNDETGRKMPKFYADIRSTSAPIEITSISSSGQALGFAIRHGWRGLVTFPRILYQAGILSVIKRMRFYIKPEILDKSICRQSTRLEIALQKSFHKYLAAKVNSGSKSVCIEYTSPNNINEILESLISETGYKKTTVEVQVLSPKFYVEWACMAQNPTEFIKLQLSETDIEKRKLRVHVKDDGDANGVEILDVLLRSHIEGVEGHQKLSLWNRSCNKGLSFLQNAYASKTLPPNRRGLPTSTTGNINETLYGADRFDVLKALLVELIAFGDEGILRLYGYLTTAAIFVSLWRFSLS